jgi:hypothetical protein
VPPRPRSGADFTHIRNTDMTIQESSPAALARRAHIEALLAATPTYPPRSTACSSPISGARPTRSTSA